jgi:hypothetical protein
VSFNRNDPRIEYIQLFSMLKMIDIIAKLEICSWSERMPAVWAILEMKKALDETTNHSFLKEPL